MNVLFEILKITLPVIITGVITFLITKYTYNNNRPLDKLEIAYDRVYYPLYKLIKNESINKNIDLIISKTEKYLNRNDKYIDRSTLHAFRSLCKCNTETKKKDAYENFKDNIYNRNSYLRRKLGYLEPSFLQTYMYMSKAEKSTFRIVVEFCCTYLFALFGSLFTGKVQSVLICISATIFIIMIGELICKFVRFLYYTIRK